MTGAPHHQPEGRGVIGHRLSVSGDYLGLWRGLLISSPERAFCDLGAVLSFPDLVAAGDHLIKRGFQLTTQQKLRDAVIAFSGRRGKPALRAAVELLNERAESRRESHLRVMIAQGSILGLAVNLPITTSGGYRYISPFPPARS